MICRSRGENLTEMVQFSFALSPRMRSFIELRDALACLESARASKQGSVWLHAASDLHDSLLGEHGRKSAIPEMISLLSDMQSYLNKLSQEAPRYQESIKNACDKLESHVSELQSGLPDATNFLSQDALLNAYLNAQKKHDWLGHRLCMQQSLKVIWENSQQRVNPLHKGLAPLASAVTNLNDMLSDFVRWRHDTAIGGTGHINPERGTSYGLLIIGLPAEAVANGVIPDISGNRLAIRLRFQRWLPGLPPQDISEDQSYARMLVPVGAQ